MVVPQKSVCEQLVLQRLRIWHGRPFAGLSYLLVTCRLAKLKGFRISPMMLGNYLWGWAKSEACLADQRHISKETLFY